MSALLDLVLPRSCLGCDRPGIPLCPACRAGLGPPRRHRPRPCPAAFPATWVAGGYDGGLQAAVLALKERGRSDLLAALATVLAGTVRAAVGGRHSAVLLVPIPSSRPAARRRGGDHMLALARRTAGVLARTGSSVAVAPALRLRRTPADSAGLGAAERAANLSGLFTATALPVGLPVVLLDDVVTTGATLSAAAQALRGQGSRPVAAVLAGTARRRPPPVSPAGPEGLASGTHRG